MKEINFAVLILLFGLSLCHSRKVSQDRSTIIIEDCKLDRKVHVGDTVIIRLVQYPARGYSWSLSDTVGFYKGIKFIAKDIDVNRNEKDDSPQVVSFKFAIQSASNVALHFQYRRPWESNKPAYKKCDLVFAIIENDSK